MRSRFSHCVVVMLTVCMLWMIFAMPVLAQDVTTPTDLSGAKGTPAPDTQQSASPAPTEAADPLPQVVGFDTSALPEGFAVAYGTAEAALGLPAELTAIFSDNTTAPVAVTWACVSDGLGGTAYNPLHENIAEAYFVFQAALAEDMACQAELPQVCVVFADGPAVLAENDLTPYGISGEGDYTIHTSETEGVADYIELKSGSFTVATNLTNCGKIVISGEATLQVKGATIPVEVQNGSADVNLSGFFGSLQVSSSSVDMSNVTVNSMTITSGDITVNKSTIINFTMSGGSLQISETEVRTVPEISGGTVSVTSSSTLMSALDVKGGTVNVSDSTVQGSLSMEGGTITISDSTVNNICVTGGETTLSNCSGGYASIDGGSFTLTGSGSSLKFVAISYYAANNIIVTVNDGARIEESQLGTGRFTANGAILGKVHVTGSECDFQNCTISQLVIDALPESGKFSAGKQNNITKLEVGAGPIYYAILKDLVIDKEYVEAYEPLPTFTVENVTLNESYSDKVILPYDSYKLVYTPYNNKTVAEAAGTNTLYTATLLRKTM